MNGLAYWGKSFKLNRIAGSTCSAIGIPKNPRPHVRARSFTELGTEARTLSLRKAMEVLPGIEFDLVLQDFSYLETYAMVTAEGVVPAHDIVFTDGVEIGKFSNCKVARCEMSVPRASVEAAITILAESYAVVSPAPSWDTPIAFDPMTFMDVQSFTIGGGSDLKTLFRDLRFAVDNRVVAEYFGTGVTPDVEEQEAVYSGSVVIPRTAAALLADVLTGTPVEVVISLKDHETTPVTKTFTFSDCILTLSRIEIRGLGIELERIEWEPTSLAIT